MSITLKDLRELIFHFYGIKDFRGRKKLAVKAKRMFCYIAVNYGDGYSMAYIGRFIGIDNSAVLYHRNKMNAFCRIYPDQRQEVETIKNLIDERPQ